MLGRTALRVEDLHTVYRSGGRQTSVVHGVSFHVNRGEIVGLVGESGSGKSTVLKSLLDTLGPSGRATSRALEVAGRDVHALQRSEYHKLRGVEMSLISQDPVNSFNPAFSVGSQFRRVLKHLYPRLGRRELDDLVLEQLRGVGIDGRGKLRAFPFQFSQGQLQRIMIALATSSDRLQVLLADEPTTSLDVTIEAQILDLIRRRRDERNLAVVLVTHNLPVVAEICDRVLVMYAGRIVEDAPVRELFRDPQHSYTKQLIKAIPAFPRADNRPPLTISAPDNTLRPVLQQTSGGTSWASCHLPVAGARKPGDVHD